MDVNNKRIAKNTILLYIRTLFIMIISLYTVRLILEALGAEDYGIYNIVGGVVATIGVINASLSGAASRFISFAIGENNEAKLKMTYSTVKIIHWLLAAVVLVIGETIGLWFVSTQLVIPSERMAAAIACYQISLITSIVSIISVPYNALIIGYERMDAYAYISILEAVLKLIVVFLLSIFPWDSLVVYSVLILVSQIIVRLAYNIYCYKVFGVTRSKLSFDNNIFKESLSFAGWTFTGQLAYIGYTQGLNILLNIFFGPIVNAARAISVQIQTAAGVLVKNFQTAVRPQIIKTWAQNDIKYMHQLVVSSTKYSYYLTAIMVFPLVWFTSPALTIWLKDVPDYTIAFVQVILITMLVESLSHGMIVAIHATGTIVKFQIYESLTLLTVLPISYIALKWFSVSPTSVFWIYLCVQIFAQFVRMWIVLPQIYLSIAQYIKNAILPVFLPTFVLFIPCVCCKYFEGFNILQTILALIISVLLVMGVIFLLGLKQAERLFIIEKIKTLVRKLYKK